jgi:hypothetical protein
VAPLHPLLPCLHESNVNVKVSHWTCVAQHCYTVLKPQTCFVCKWWVSGGGWECLPCAQLQLIIHILSLVVGIVVCIVDAPVQITHGLHKREWVSRDEGGMSHLLKLRSCWTVRVGYEEMKKRQQQLTSHIRQRRCSGPVH